MVGPGSWAAGQLAPPMAAGANPNGALEHPYPQEYTTVPSGWVMEVAAASRLNVAVPAVPSVDDPTIPGAAAMADSASKDPNVIAAPRKTCSSVVFVFMPLIAALLGSADFGGRVD
jgi:hypothetical protein